MGANNLTVYVMLYRKGLRSVRTGDEEEDLANGYFTPTEDEIKATEIIEAVVHIDYVIQTQTAYPLSVPARIYFNPSDFYELELEAGTLPGATIATSAAGDYFNITTTAGAGTYFILLKTTVNGTTVQRPLFIRVTA
jgi:hypothetical protein